MSIILHPIRVALIAVVLAGAAERLWADTDAVTVTGGNSIASYVPGAVGFSFVPITNLLVTRVGFYDGDDFGDARISIWSSTNTVIASYDLGPSTSSQTAIYTNVAISLLAGQTYGITVQDGPLAEGNTLLARAYLPEAGGQIAVAPELAQYVAVTVSPAGVFTPGGTNDFQFGVNFSYQVLIGPQLSINLVGSNSAVVSWPSPSTGFLLQQNMNPAKTNWTYYTGATNDNGTIKSATISPSAGNLFFRLRFVPF